MGNGLASSGPPRTLTRGRAHPSDKERTSDETRSQNHTACPPTGRRKSQFVQDTDPGYVGTGRLWVDTSTNPPTLKIRNTAGTGWVTQGGDSSGGWTIRDLNEGGEYTAEPGQLIVITSGGEYAIALPATPAAGTQIGFIITGGEVALEIGTGDESTINGESSIDLSTTYATLVLAYDANTTTWAILSQQPATGGSGSAPSGTLVGASSPTNAVFADAETNVPCDGANHNVPCLIASPPAWMDDAGNIIAAGVYSLTAFIAQVTAPTTPALYGVLEPPGNFLNPFALDSTLTTGNITPSPVVFALKTTDLPYSITQIVHAQTDVSGVLSVQPMVAQIASATT